MKTALPSFFRRRRKPLRLLLALLFSLLSYGIYLLSPQGPAPADRDSFRTPVKGEQLELHFIDVGQADAALIRQGEHAMLIDGGNRNDSERIYTYLRKENINRLDYIVATHPHEDHIGGIPGALRWADVGTVFSSYDDYDSQSFRTLVKAVRNRGKELVVPEPGDVYPLGEAHFTILAPRRKYTDVNNNSLVLRLSFGTQNFLFAADAERSSENDMLNAGLDLQSLILKVGHHGSKTSSSQAFLEAVQPDYAIISCGRDNDYAYPNEAVLSRLRRIGAKICRTDRSGDIRFLADGVNLSLDTPQSA